MKQVLNDIDTQYEFSKFIEDKSLIIVGPATTLEGSKMGKFIDSFDIVCRINECFTQPVEEDYGKRCDIMFLGGVSEQSLLNLRKSMWSQRFDVDEEVTWIICPQSTQTVEGKKESFKDYTDEFETVTQTGLVTHDWWDEHCLAMDVLHRDFVPWAYGANTGTLAILLLSEFITDFSIAGFTFFMDGFEFDKRHHAAYRQNAGDQNTHELAEVWKIHDPEKQVDYLTKQIAEKDMNIKVDKYMKKHIFPSCRSLK